MRKKYREEIHFLETQICDLQARYDNTRFELKQARQSIDELNNKIDILEFTGTFNSDKIQVTLTNGPQIGFINGKMTLVHDSLKCKYLNDKGKFTTIVYVIDKGVSYDDEPELIDNCKSSATIKIKNRWFKLDKIQGVIVEIPVPKEKKTQKKDSSCDQK